MKFKKILVANRGEIAVRIIKAAKEMDIATVAVYSEADRNAIFTKIADESVCIGEADPVSSYLNIYNIFSAAKIKNVDAIHPGIGFLAEDGNFAEICEQLNIAYIGPTSSNIYSMGNKFRAKNIAQECDIPIIKGCLLSEDINEAYRQITEDIKLPCILKAVSAGGGKGIKVIECKQDIISNIKLCRKEAKGFLGNSDIIAEQYLKNTRHIEVQILSDKFGNIIHLGDRECTIQRGNQKLIEESISQNISENLRSVLYDSAIKIAKYINYVGAGTVEFLVLPDEKYFFLEMNTRLQVEHTITELITGVDIVQKQIEIAQGGLLNIEQKDWGKDLYAMQCRIISERPEESFKPSFGEITKLSLPGGNGIRIDAGYSSGDKITPYYDSLILKMSCLGKNKSCVIKKALISLKELEIEGINTNIAFLKFLIKDQKFFNGKYDNNFVKEKLCEFCGDEKLYTIYDES